MDIKILKYFIVAIAVQVVLHTVQLGALCPSDNCSSGGYFFAPGRNMANNHALRGHVLDNFTVKQPLECFRKCTCDCRCISFNYLTNVDEKNCELNEENRYTNFMALKFVEGSQYYDLTVDYDLRTNFPVASCRYGCCASQPCLNGGTCHEPCDVTSKRFTCSCKPNFTGTFCETVICPTLDWLQFNGSCFKGFTEKVNWFQAQNSCLGFHSNLTSIHSAEENEFVRDKVASFSEKVWIGFNNLKTKAAFEWVDGSAVSFINWDNGEPNSGGSHNCAELYVNVPSGFENYTWNDLDCYRRKLSYVCKWNP